MSKPFYVSLPNRGLLHIEGEDRVDFLQGLITQDVEKLVEQKIQYGCLLTPQGKFLHDFFLYHGDGFIMLECEGGERAKDLYNRLLRYKMRSDVQISVEENAPIYMIFNSDSGLQDPRSDALGYRSFDKSDFEEKPIEHYETIRIKNAISEGSKDIEIEKSTLLECNIDKLNGVDFDKGCYMGQELTARMHYRNLGKKNIRTLQFKDTPPEPFTDLYLGERLIGNMRSSCGDIGLAMIKNDAVEELSNGDQHPFCLLG